MVCGENAFLDILKKCFNKMQLLDEMLKEIQWNLKMMNGLGSLSEVVSLKMCISRKRN